MRASSFIRATSASTLANFSSPRIQPTNATSIVLAVEVAGKVEQERSSSGAPLSKVGRRPKLATPVPPAAVDEAPTA